MLGFLLYEVFDIAFHIGKLGFNSVSGLYSWYYGLSEEQKKEIPEDKLFLLEARIKELEDILSNEREKRNEKIDRILQGKEDEPDKDIMGNLYPKVDNLNSDNNEDDVNNVTETNTPERVHEPILMPELEGE